MTKKNYIAIADVIAGLMGDPANDTETLSRVVNMLADVFADDNPRFDAGRFYAACEG